MGRLAVIFVMYTKIFIDLNVFKERLVFDFNSY